MLAFIFFFLLWLLFNGRCSWDVIGFGLVFSAAVTAFAVKICGWSEARGRRILRLSGLLAAYFCQLFVEILKANLATIRAILSPGLREVRPQIFRFDSGLKRGFAQTILSNSITSTYTVNVEKDGVLTVHALNTEFAEGTPDSDLNRRLLAIEERLKKLNEKTGEEGAG